MKFKKLLTLGLVGIMAVTGGAMLSGCKDKDDDKNPPVIELTEQQKIDRVKSVLSNLKAESDRIDNVTTTVANQNPTLDVFKAFGVENSVENLGDIFDSQFEHFDSYLEYKDKTQLNLNDYVMSVLTNIFTVQDFEFGKMVKYYVPYTYEGDDKLYLYDKNGRLIYSEDSILYMLKSSEETWDEERWQDISFYKINYNSDLKVTSVEVFEFELDLYHDTQVKSIYYTKTNVSTSASRVADSVVELIKDEDGYHLDIISEIDGKQVEMNVTDQTVKTKMDAVFNEVLTDLLINY